MTKQYFYQMASYNLYANTKIASWCDSLSEEQWNRNLVSSFDSIGATVLHIIGAEYIWYQRMQKEPNPLWLPATFKGDKSETLTKFLEYSQLLYEFTLGFEQSKMNENLLYTRLNGDKFERPYYEILAHVFNHSTYHRGQIVTLLRQVGFTEVSSTDLLLNLHNSK